MSDHQELEIPTDFVCPITNEIMQDPVLSKYGHSYERSAIVEWLAAHSNTCPLTRRKMHLSDLITNQPLRILIRQWQIDNQEDVTVLAPDAEKQIIGYFDLPLRDEPDETERTESSDSENEEFSSYLSRPRGQRRRPARGASAAHRQFRQQRDQAEATRSMAQTFLENHRRRIRSYLRPSESTSD